MSPEHAEVFLRSQIACAMIQMEGMKAENADRQARGHSVAFTYMAFDSLIDQYGIGANDAIRILRGE